jgi:amidase
MPIYTFTPTHYFNVLATVPPVLTIAPGDTVRTTTVDAHGFDAARRQVNAARQPDDRPLFRRGG